ncbi:MAG: hypothetical protein COB36_06400 [Alphaproteobacteria bacterium]|nr:MAG: hypothetical protein COB36_06400 [Alphaproteobacteria bacterium]
MKKRIFRWAILLVVGFGIGSGIGYLKAQRTLDSGVIPLSPDDQSAASAATILKQPVSTENNTTSAASNIGGAFTLIDHNGQEVTNDTYADMYKLVFFGFTYCPAVCPTELQKITRIMDELGEDYAHTITPMFITVDPERDDVETMKNYVTQFHPSLVGLTGSNEQIEAVKNAFKVYSSKVENDMMDEYMIDHSSFIYLMDWDNHLISMYPSKDTVTDIIRDINKNNI